MICCLLVVCCVFFACWLLLLLWSLMLLLLLLSVLPVRRKPVLLLCSCNLDSNSAGSHAKLNHVWSCVSCCVFVIVVCCCLFFCRLLWLFNLVLTITVAIVVAIIL